MTAWGEDSDGRPYVGIQAVRDRLPALLGGAIAFAVFLALFIAIRVRAAESPSPDLENHEGQRGLRLSASPSSCSRTSRSTSS